MSELFTTASRLKLRFDTKQGQLSAEDLWDLPLTSTSSHRVTLDEIAVGLNKQLQDAGTTSFVKKSAKGSEILKLKFDIVIEIIGVRQAEEDAAETKRVNAEKKQQILEIIAQRENEELASKPIDELRALVTAL